MRFGRNLVIALATAGSTAWCADYAAWARKNPDGSWTAATERAVASSKLPNSVPSDVDRFCPAYKDKDAEDRKKFWVGLISILARPESNFKPETTYTEAFKDSHGANVVSRGLLQISYESANQSRYGCAIRRPEDLHDPATNLACGVKILDALVRMDNAIAAYGPKAVGGARYWSTLRSPKGHLAELTTFTQALPVCIRKGGGRA